MHGAPVNVHVPDFQKLKNYTVEQDELKLLITEYQVRLSALERDSLKSSSEVSSDLGVMTESSRKRARVLAEAETLHSLIEKTERQLGESYSARQTWVDTFAEMIFRRQKLTAELGSALEDQNYTLVIGNRPRRRAEVEEELLDVVRTLALWAGDRKLQVEAEALEKQIADSRDYVTATECFYVSADRTRLLRENELGAEPGVTTLYGRGTRIPKEEARKWGLTA